LSLYACKGFTVATTRTIFPWAVTLQIVPFDGAIVAPFVDSIRVGPIVYILYRGKIGVLASRLGAE
jgi:hypothetical protein